MVRLIVAAAAIALATGPALAQMSPFGGSIPFLVNPYPVYGQGQPMQPGAGPNPANGACAPTFAGRGGARYPCSEDAPRDQPR